MDELKTTIEKEEENLAGSLCRGREVCLVRGTNPDLSNDVPGKNWPASLMP